MPILGASILLKKELAKNSQNKKGESAMNRNSWFAKLVERDLGKFPGRIREIISGHEVFQENGWGKGFSGRHFKKMINRDESIFTTTWAELRQEYFRCLLKMIGGSFDGYKIPLPCHLDGTVLSDKEIREKVKDDYKLMFCPVVTKQDIKNLHILPNFHADLMLGKESLLQDIEWSLRHTGGKPYWYWIDCSKNGSDFLNEIVAENSPNLVEYLIADTFFKEETGNHLDNKNYTWLSHRCNNTERIILGGHPPVKIMRSQSYGRFYQGESGEILESTSSKYPAIVRFVEIV